MSEPERPSEVERPTPGVLYRRPDRCLTHRRARGTEGADREILRLQPAGTNRKVDADSHPTDVDDATQRAGSGFRPDHPVLESRRSRGRDRDHDRSAEKASGGDIRGTRVNRRPRRKRITTVPDCAEKHPVLHGGGGGIQGDGRGRRRGVGDLEAPMDHRAGSDVGHNVDPALRTAGCIGGRSDEPYADATGACRWGERARHGGCPSRHGRGNAQCERYGDAATDPCGAPKEAATFVAREQIA
jgi:hypothetical protein